MSSPLSGHVLRFLSGIAEQYDERPMRFRSDLEAMIKQDRLGDALVLLLAQQCRIERVGGLSPTLDARLLATGEGLAPDPAHVYMAQRIAERAARPAGEPPPAASGGGPEGGNGWD